MLHQYRITDANPGVATIIEKKKKKTYASVGTDDSIKQRVPNLKVQRPNRLMKTGLDMGRVRGADAFFHSKLTPFIFFTTRKLAHLPIHFDTKLSSLP